MPILTVTEAAKAAHKSRATLYRHIKKGDLSARQQPDGSKGIDTSELIRVFGPLQQETSQARKTAHHETEPNTALLQSRIEALERENELLRRELADAKNEKGRLLGLLEQRLLAGMQTKHRHKGKKKS